MERTGRTNFICDYSQSVVRPVEEDGGAPKVGDFTVVGDGKVSIPQRKVPEDVLETRSVAAAIPQQPRVTIPESWLEFTVENTAHLTEDEIFQRLLFQGRFDPSKFGLMLFLPNGHPIAIQLINGMSGDFLLKSIGGNIKSANDFMYILFEKKYIAKKKEKIEIPTANQVGDWIQSECESLPKGKVDELANVLFRPMTDVFTDEGKRRSIESKVRNIVDLIFSKLPPPNKKNRIYWNNIYEAVRTMKANPDKSKEKLAEVKKRLKNSRN